MGKGGGDCDRPAMLLTADDGDQQPLHAAYAARADALAAGLVDFADEQLERSELTDAEREQMVADELARLQAAFEEELLYELGAPDPYITPKVVHLLAMRIKAYHALCHHKMDKLAFEEALHDGYEVGGFAVSKPPSMTNPGYDLVVDGRRVSLKTETPRDPNLVVISKLMELRGLAKVRTKAQALEKVDTVREHLARYDQIITLRSTETPLPSGGSKVEYEMVEVPHTVLAGLEDLTERDFRRPRAGSGTTSARVNFNGEWAFTLQLDGSVEKVTIRNLRKDLCRVLATFEDTLRPSGLVLPAQP